MIFHEHIAIASLGTSVKFLCLTFALLTFALVTPRWGNIPRPKGHPLKKGDCGLLMILPYLFLIIMLHVKNLLRIVPKNNNIDNY